MPTHPTREHLERTRLTWRGARLDVPSPDPDDRPPTAREWSGPQHRLTGNRAVSGWPASDALGGIVGVATPPSDEWLASLVHATIGVTGRVEGHSGSHLLRAAASVGNGHSVEAFLVCDDLLPDVPAGVHHVDALRGLLTTVRAGDHRATLADAVADPRIAGAAATLVLTGVPWRQIWRYGERGYRHVFWDLGHVLANVVVHGVAHDMTAQIDLGFDDILVSELLGIDDDEIPLAVCPLGTSRSSAPLRAEIGEQLAHARPIERSDAALARAQRIARAGRMDADQIEGFRREVSAVHHQLSQRVSDVPDRTDFATIEDTISRRRTARQMRPTTLDQDDVEWLLSTAAAAVPFDVNPDGRRLTSTTVIVHAVDRRRPGRYAWTSLGLEPMHAGDLRAEALTACMDQHVARDAAALVISTVDVDLLLDTAGGRAIRVAQVEAGVTAGRLQLAAELLGLAATSLTFLDEELADLAGRGEMALLVTAIGTPTDG